MVAHIDGNESNIAPSNLGLTCRSCNARVAHIMKRLGIGRRTKQYNPAGGGAKTLAQWLTAVTSMKGENETMPVDAAVEMIHATLPGERSRFAREIWRLRREHGTDRNQDKVPF